MKNWPRPLTPKDIRSFMGLANNHSRFVDGFSTIAASLKDLTMMKVKFTRSKKFEKSSKTDSLQP